MTKTFVVIGSNCFTGSHVVDALLANPSHRVIGIGRAPESKALYLPYKSRDLANFEFRRFDLVTQMDALLAFLAELKPAVVVNVAALSEVGLSNESPVEYFQTNTLAVVRLTDFLRRQPWLERYVHISSAEIFGPCPEPLDENALFNPSTPYAVSKAAGDMQINTLIKNFGFKALIVRSTNVYGRHQQLFKIIPRTVINVKLGRPIELHGGGTSKKCFVHVRDVVDGMLLALEKGATGTYHFSVVSDRTVADVVRLTCRAMGADPERCVRIVGERLGQDSQYVLNCDKARRELGWTPRVAFEDGVRETIEWIEGHWSEIPSEPLQYVHRVSRPAS
jgi:dTDP-glucose 4,6-dehydratase